MINTRDSLLNFTDNSWNELYEVIDDPQFAGREADQIYQSLLKTGPVIPFCDYLKRFLYQGAGLSGSYQDIPLSEYQGILRTAFHETKTPVSFSDVSSRFSAVSANWLTQKTVSRDTVLLLGFGLSLSPSEVNDFLLKALHADALLPSVPKEVIAAYCFDHGYGFSVFEKLLALYESGETARPHDAEEQLHFDRLQAIKDEKKGPETEPFAAFLNLYHQVQSCLAGDLNLSARPHAPILADQISPARIEAILYEGVPYDDGDNLMPLRDSSLDGIFSAERLTRQRIRSLLQQRIPVRRSDLITLNFFLWSHEDSRNLQKRYIAFTEDTNRILKYCGFGELYAALPYERFLMMCMLTNNPLQTGTEVWEKSYQDAADMT